MEYFLCMVFFGVGLYALLTKRNLLKIIIGVSLMGYAVNVFILLCGYRRGGAAPILEKGAAPAAMADPLAQALALTTVVIGLAITVFLAALAVRLHEKYGTLDVTELRRLKG